MKGHFIERVIFHVHMRLLHYMLRPPRGVEVVDA